MCHVVLAAVVFAATGSGQRGAPGPTSNFPPDIFENRSVDEARIAPDRCVVEIDNERLRVLRIKLPSAGRLPIHSHRSGVIVAVTELNLRLKAPDNSVIEVRLPVGDIRWIDAGIHADENLSPTAAEYLFIESKG
jgi:quercetin dioxygenase-like cupin family protein